MMNGRLRIIFAYMSFLVLLAFSANGLLINITAESGDWPQFCHDSRHSGYSSSKIKNETELAWTFNTSGAVRSSPAVANDMVYVGSDDGWVYALNMSSGDLIWSFKTQGAVKSSPLLSDHILYVGSFDNRIYALDALSGAHIWNYTTDDDIEGSPSNWNGIVLIGN